ncbi:hypothetical protein WA016_07325 [Myxococcus stipitatus]
MTRDSAFAIRAKPTQTAANAVRTSFHFNQSTCPPTYARPGHPETPTHPGSTSTTSRSNLNKPPKPRIQTTLCRSSIQSNIINITSTNQPLHHHNQSPQKTTITPHGLLNQNKHASHPSSSQCTAHSKSDIFRRNREAHEPRNALNKTGDYSQPQKSPQNPSQKTRQLSQYFLSIYPPTIRTNHNPPVPHLHATRLLHCFRQLKPMKSHNPFNNIRRSPRPQPTPNIKIYGQLHNAPTPTE